MKKVTNEQFNREYKKQDNLNIMNSATKKYSKYLSPDIQKRCGMHGLWRCIQNHDDKYGRKFTTSLFIHVVWECKREMTALHKKPISFLGDSDKEIPSENKANPDISEIMEMLSEEQKNILFQRFYENKTLEEIGKTMGYSKEAARQNINKIIQKVRDFSPTFGV